MTTKSQLLVELTKLASLQSNSNNLYQVVQKTVLLAFEQSKPLFADGPEKNRAANFLEKSLPLLPKGFATLSGSLNPDRRELAQKCRSGLQYLVDEFSANPELYQKAQLILQSPPVKNVEEYIECTRDIPPENPDFAAFVTPEQRALIPQSHFWWF